MERFSVPVGRNSAEYATELVLHGRLLPTAGGFTVLLRDEQHATYAEALASEATLRGAWPRVELPSEDLLRVVHATWEQVAGGWTAGRTPSDLCGLVAHSSIGHHLRMVGYILLNPAQVRAVGVLRSNPGMASQWVDVYDSPPRTMTISEALLQDMALVRSERILDTDDFDEYDGVGGHKYVTTPTSGKSVAMWVSCGN